MGMKKAWEHQKTSFLRTNSDKAVSTVSLHKLACKALMGTLSFKKVGPIPIFAGCTEFWTQDTNVTHE